MVNASKEAVSKVSYVPPEWKEYVGGGATAVVNIAITFPLNKVMFRQMVHGLSALDSVKQLYHEGLYRLYRGSLPPLGKQTITRSLMFGNYALFSRQIHEYHPSWKPETVLIFASFLSGCTEAVLTPFERIQVILQDSKQHNNYANTADALQKIKSNFGISELYRGMTAITFRNGAGNIVFFYAKEKSKLWNFTSTQQGAAKDHIGWRVTLNNFLTGSVVGATVSTLFYPMNVIKTHMQLKVGGSFLRFTDVLTKVLKERGFKGMWQGVHINYSRSFISWGIINATYEIVSDLLH